MDLEEFLTGENLAFYKNIRDLKEMTANARALIKRSHTMYNNIIQGEEFKKRLRATEVEEDQSSLKSNHGECLECGLVHGAHDYCIVQQIVAVDKKRMDTQKKSAAAPLPVEYPKFDDEERSVPPIHTLQPTVEKVKKWEALLYREMTLEEENAEYSKIYYRYGEKTGRKFLLARSMARESVEVKPLFLDDKDLRERNRNKGSKISLITKDCVLQNRKDYPQTCPESSPDLWSKMATILDFEHPCTTKPRRQEKSWKSALKAHHNEEIDCRETVKECSSSHSTPQRSIINSESCGCGLKDCECGDVPVCNPQKKCQLLADVRNNYLFTIREKMNKRRLLKGKAPPLEGFHHLSQTNSKEVSRDDVFRHDSDSMMKKANTLHAKELKDCLTLSIGKVDAKLDENISKVAELSSTFAKPDEKAWDRWIENFHRQDENEDDEGVSGDSDISTTQCNSVTSSSTTDRELERPVSVKRIPFVEEPLKLVDILFAKIYSRFRKTFQKNSTRKMHNRYKRAFFSQLDYLRALKCTGSIGGEVLDQLNLHYLFLKSLKPKIVLKNQRLKKLRARKKTLSRTIKRRNRIEGVQLGKRYFKRFKKSIDYTADREFIGFSPQHRVLIKKRSPEKYHCDFVGDENVALLSKKRIHYHHRLLKTLFNGRMDSGEKESLMDEGMRERLQKFKKSLHINSSHSRLFGDSDTEDEGEMLKAASIPIRTPLKKEEKKLKSASGNCPVATKSQRNSKRALSSDFCQDFSPLAETSSTRLNSRRIQSEHQEPQSRKFSTSAVSRHSPYRWSDYSLSLSQVPISKTSWNSSHASPLSSSKPTRASVYSPRRAVLSAGSGHSVAQLEPIRLPTPPISDSCDDTEYDMARHRVPPKEEAHMERSARIEQNRDKQNKEMDESDFNDNSSDSYVPKLLKIPQRKDSANSGLMNLHQFQRRFGRLKNRGRAVHVPDSSSSDELDDRNISRERQAWDHKSGFSTGVAPHMDTKAYGQQHDVVSPRRNNRHEPSISHHNLKHTHTSPLPKAGRSILKNRLPKPPADGIRENQSMNQASESDPVKGPSFSDASYKTTSWPSEGLIKPARVVTERLLRATQGTPEDLLTGSSKKHSVLSRVTPDAAPSAQISAPSEMKKTSGGTLLGVSRSGQNEEISEDNSLTIPQSVRIQQRGNSSTHRRSGDKSPMESVVGESIQLPRSSSVTVSSTKRLSKKASSKIVSDIFRKRSLVTPDSDSIQPKSLTKAVADEDPNTAQKIDSQAASNSSVTAKVKKLEAIGPTKRRVFGLDIGQGINCVNYLKEAAPGADEMKKKELVDLLVTQVEVKKTPKKANIEKEASSNSATLLKRESMSESTSASLLSAKSSKAKQIQSQMIHDTSPLTRTSFKTLDQIYKEVHGINRNNTPHKLLDHEYEFEAKTRQQLTKHKLLP